EKVDGSGYPRGLKKDQIHLYAKIVAVADVYDALVADRVYRHAFSSQEAAELITCGCNIHFDHEIAKAFLKHISIFPVGSVVKLSTGDLAVVVDINKDLQTRPIVRVVATKELYHSYGVELDLCKHPTIIIERIIKPTDAEYNSTM
ncbi:MAG: HD-GYP domain-containing protein, partial [Bacillota bacterium]|nr:HD-GYP domain-containing protein [Bacillota bacterium]